MTCSLGVAGGAERQEPGARSLRAIKPRGLPANGNRRKRLVPFSAEQRCAIMQLRKL
jgi:hypothetical protein